MDNFVKGEQGKCPICGSEMIEYFGGELDDAGYSYDCRCEKCNSSFLECYDFKFAGYII